ncbi:sulfatase [Fulvivirgaceae bacterium BMA12]|uniref:Sulfatase n=1 Tax=Agaribacillus aureus TaxID=3051825 RepID=A0ABT8LGV4_9BACT|nr:sulfatase [Fulvivirgaceae bacterium BMA12]
MTFHKKLSVPFILCLILIFGCSGGKENETVNSLPAKKRPNIIFIMTDDHAKSAVSLYGSKLIQTPNIDRIGKEGMVFNNAFVTNALCGPSRAVMLTGKFSHINGFRDNRDKFDGDQPTVIKHLQKSGYYTSMIGKWHLRSVPQGFDYWNILINQGNYYNPNMVEMGDTLRREGYTTDIITDLTIETIDKQVNREQPFCVLMHQKAPHRGWMPNVKHLTPGDTTRYPLPETFYDDYKNRSAAAGEQDMEIKNMFYSMDMKLHPAEEPGSGGQASFDAKANWENIYKRLTPAQKEAWDAYYKPISEAFYRDNPKGRELEEWMYQRYISDYLKTIVSVDENIGRLLDYLEEKELLDNTLIIYTSDQGFFLGEHGWYDKRFMYEPSLSIPLVMRLPGLITANSTTDVLAQNIDFAPTLLEIASIEVPDDMQGRSLKPVLEGTSKDWRDEIYYHYYEYPHGWHNVKRHYGIRTERYKLIHFYNDIDAWEMYDLENDPNEMENLFDDPAHTEKREELTTRLAKLRIAMKDTTQLLP